LFVRNTTKHISILFQASIHPNPSCKLTNMNYKKSIGN
jgi:hypothetical protein